MYEKGVIFVICLTSIVTFTNGNLHSKCTYDSECLVDRTFCRGNSVCECMFGYAEINDRCFARVGTPCKSSPDCSTLQYSYCQQDVCSCIRDYVAYPNGSVCLPRGYHRGHCEIHEQCKLTLGDFAECTPKNKTCICLPNYHFISKNESCIRNKGYNEMCEHSDECHDSDVREQVMECMNRTCKCRNGIVLENGKCKNAASTLAQSALLLCLFVFASIVLGEKISH